MVSNDTFQNLDYSQPFIYDIRSTHSRSFSDYNLRTGQVWYNPKCSELVILTWDNPDNWRGLRAGASVFCYETGEWRPYKRYNHTLQELMIYAHRNGWKFVEFI